MRDRVDSVIWMDGQWFSLGHDRSPSLTGSDDQDQVGLPEIIVDLVHLKDDWTFVSAIRIAGDLSDVLTIIRNSRFR